jgi:hypothetical protein
MIRFWDFKLSGAPPLLSWVDYEAVGRSSVVSRFFSGSVKFLLLER